MEIIKPLKRSTHLKPLSRDHHDGLLLCWKIRKAREQHKELNWLIQKIIRTDDSEKALLAAFADLLEDHIRFEERQLFPYIEKNADPDSFDHAGKIIADLHGNHSTVSWEDEFWIKQAK